MKNKVVKQMHSLEQLTNSYYIAKTINALRADGELDVMKFEDYELVENWSPKVRDELHEYWLHNVFPMVKEKIHILLILKVIFEDIEKYNLKEDSSITESSKDNEHLVKIARNNDGFDLLKKINLEEHTLHVTSQMLTILRNIIDDDTDILIISSLLHDFGKSTLIRKEIAPETMAKGTFFFKPHMEISGMYVDSILMPKIFKIVESNDSLKRYKRPLESILKKISDFVINHHETSKQWKNRNIKLREADTLAREKELLNLKIGN
jgi:hypothetical protein